MATPANTDEARELFEEYLRKQGLKMTEQRRVMLKTALAHQGHFTSEDVHARLRAEGYSQISLATVYRTMKLLEKSEILEGHDFADKSGDDVRGKSRRFHLLALMFQNF